MLRSFFFAYLANGVNAHTLKQEKTQLKISSIQMGAIILHDGDVVDLIKESEYKRIIWIVLRW